MSILDKQDKETLNAALRRALWTFAEVLLPGLTVGDKIIGVNALLPTLEFALICALVAFVKCLIASMPEVGRIATNIGTVNVGVGDDGQRKYDFSVDRELDNLPLMPGDSISFTVAAPDVKAE